MTLDQLSEFGKSFARREKGLNNRANDRLRPFDHGEAGHDSHFAYQGVHADQRRNVRFVVRQGVSIQLRCLIDELLIE
jgi:hypothetical protein